MKNILIVIAVVAAVILIPVLIFIGSYNGLINRNEEVKLKYSEIETQLQRRNDLIPNLVETVKGFASHEEEIFSNVSEARAKLAGANTVEETAEADAQMTGALSRLLAISEDYPELKSDENFRQLADELAGTENRIAFARTQYNEAAYDYARYKRRFPHTIVANMFDFENYDPFEASEEAREVPDVSF
ncbi:LemA family protein [Herbivorax sp. ANBcel31]|uniref:LemA family protein n=1 Tax=Herbivorax sp. ANBcel31 TaxID=3069754 RepID=UPI0027B20F17|nr:LemA family protein [Herbivorax sp. ANBcel31]MDQ2087882.1 LemA family protein [Herbivorax sp. ANBcel31]